MSLKRDESGTKGTKTIGNSEDRLSSVHPRENSVDIYSLVCP